MKKIAISLLVLALVAAFSATGVVSAATCAATTSTCATTTSAQCTSCTTAASCCCPAPVTCCCPVVATCVVTKCCEVKVVTVKAEHKEGKEAKEAGAAVATKGSAAVSGSGQASVSKQTSTITQTQSVGAITNSGDGTVTVQFAPQTATNVQANVPVNIQVKNLELNPAIAWGDASQAATNGGSNSVTVPAVE